LFAVGNVGAGTGATVAKTSGVKCAIKSGLGSSSIRLKNGIVVGSLMVVNAIGSIHDPETGALVAGPRNAKGIMSSSLDDLVTGQSEYVVDVGGNTTIGVLATNADLSEKEVSHMATVGHDGLAMAVRPAHLAGDGDTIFSLATGHLGKTVGITEYNQILAAGVVCTFRAILNAVVNAESLAGYPSVKDV
jgi:L-aminopeptidase/D-esterase-like protein